jgi:AcrR family transcriptional regulator
MDKREEILESALSHFAKTGFQGTSLSQIASGAKTQKQLITHHFGTKENLWREVVNRELNDGVELLKTAKKTAVEEGPEAAIREFIHDYIHWCARKKEFHRLMIFDSQANNPRYSWYTENHFKPSHKVMTSLIRKAQKQGVVGKGNPGRLYFTFMNMINSLVLGERTFALYTGRVPNDSSDIENLKKMIFKVLDMKP